MSLFKPMLAATADLHTLRYPLIASPKLDGIRCVVREGQVLTRSLKPLPNHFIREALSHPKYEGLDGEIIVGEAHAKDVYRTTNSGVMSREGEPPFRFHMFDRHDLTHLGFRDRLAHLPEEDLYCTPVPHHFIDKEETLLALEQHYLNFGYEGLMLRAPDGPYKQGRSTEKEGTLLKLKRFTDAEYQIVGFEERLHNGNAATVNALGYLERSSHKSNLVGRGDLGALVLAFPGGTFNCGTGFTDEDRLAIWQAREHLVGKFVKVKHFDIGVKDAPRFPVFLGFRDERDMV